MVVIEVGKGGGLAGAGIDHMDREPNIRRPALCVQRAESDNDGAEHAQ